MNDNETRFREALAKISEVASAAVNGNDEFLDEYNEENEDQADNAGALTCTPKSLPARLLVKASETATKLNPVNAPAFSGFAKLGADFDISDPQFIAVLTTKYWGPTARRLTVSFMETTPADLKARIISHMNAWNRTAGISFVGTSGVGNVRISRGAGGYYSYLGTDIMLIPASRQTMNLQGFTMSTPESEYKRVVRHETGHTLGAPHEHMRAALVNRIDRQKAYAYFLRTQGWNQAMVDAQVLTPLSEASLLSTPADQTSIMCYQLPGSITRDGRPILGGTDINATDYAFMGRIYPRPASQTVGKGLAKSMAASADSEEAWSEAEDVEVPV